MRVMGWLGPVWDGGSGASLCEDECFPVPAAAQFEYLEFFQIASRRIRLREGRFGWTPCVAILRAADGMGADAP